MSVYFAYLNLSTRVDLFSFSDPIETIKLRRARVRSRQVYTYVFIQFISVLLHKRGHTLYGRGMSDRWSIAAASCAAVFLGALLLHLIYTVSAYLVVSFVARPRHGDKLRKTSAQTLVRNEIDSVVNGVSYAVELASETLSEVATYLRDNNGIIVAGILAVSLCIAIVDYGAYAVPAIDSAYNIMYVTTAPVVKILLNLVRLFGTAAVGVTNMIARVKGGTYQYAILQMDRPLADSYVIENLALGLGGLGTAMGHATLHWATAISNMVVDSNFVDKPHLRDDDSPYLGSIKELSHLQDVFDVYTGDVCRSLGGLDFEVVVMSVTGAFTTIHDANSDLPHRPSAFMNATASLGDLLVDFFFRLPLELTLDTLPNKWSVKQTEIGDRIEETMHDPVAAAKLPTSFKYVADSIHVLAEDTLGIVDDVLHYVSLGVACVIDTDSVKDQEDCMKGKVDVKWNYPQRSIGHAVGAAWSAPVYAVSLLVDSIVNWKILAYDAGNQNAQEILTARYIKSQVFIPHIDAFFGSFVEAGEGARKFIASISSGAALADMMRDFVTAVSHLSAWATHSAMNTLAVPDLKPCPNHTSTTPLASWQCWCDPTDTQAFVLPSPNTVGSQANETYVCTSVEETRESMLSAFSAFVQTLDECDYYQDKIDREFIPPFKVASPDKNTACGCHPSPKCVCGEPRCHCILPEMARYEDGEEIRVCNFDPEEIQVPIKNAIHDNNLVTYCTTIYGTSVNGFANAERLKTTDCVCEMTLMRPYRRPGTTDKYYCPVLCDMRIEELVDTAGDAFSYNGTTYSQNNIRDLIDKLNVSVIAENTPIFNRMYEQAFYRAWESNVRFNLYEDACMCRIDGKMLDFTNEQYAQPDPPKTIYKLLDHLPMQYGDAITDVITQSNYAFASDMELTDSTRYLQRYDLVTVQPIDALAGCTCPSIARRLYQPIDGRKIFVPEFRHERTDEEYSFKYPECRTDRMMCPTDSAFIQPLAYDPSLAMFLYKQNGFVEGTLQEATVCTCVDGRMPIDMLYMAELYNTNDIVDDKVSLGTKGIFTLDRRFACGAAIPWDVWGKGSAQANGYTPSITTKELFSLSEQEVTTKNFENVCGDDGEAPLKAIVASTGSVLLWCGGSNIVRIDSLYKKNPSKTDVKFYPIPIEQKSGYGKIKEDLYSFSCRDHIDENDGNAFLSTICIKDTITILRLGNPIVLRPLPEGTKYQEVDFTEVLDVTLYAGVFAVAAGTCSYGGKQTIGCVAATLLEGNYGITPHMQDTHMIIIQVSDATACTSMLHDYENDDLYVLCDKSGGADYRLEISEAFVIENNDVIIHLPDYLSYTIFVDDLRGEDDNDDKRSMSLDLGTMYACSYYNDGLHAYRHHRHRNKVPPAPPCPAARAPPPPPSPPPPSPPPPPPFKQFYYITFINASPARSLTIVYNDLGGSSPYVYSTEISFAEPLYDVVLVIGDENSNTYDTAFEVAATLSKKDKVQYQKFTIADVRRAVPPQLLENVRFDDNKDGTLTQLENSKYNSMNRVYILLEDFNEGATFGGRLQGVSTFPIPGVGSLLAPVSPRYGFGGVRMGLSSTRRLSSYNLISLIRDIFQSNPADLKNVLESDEAFVIDPYNPWTNDDSARYSMNMSYYDVYMTKHTVVVPTDKYFIAIKEIVIQDTFPNIPVLSFVIRDISQKITVIDLMRSDLIFDGEVKKLTTEQAVQIYKRIIFNKNGNGFQYVLSQDTMRADQMIKSALATNKTYEIINVRNFQDNTIFMGRRLLDAKGVDHGSGECLLPPVVIPQSTSKDSVLTVRSDTDDTFLIHLYEVMIADDNEVPTNKLIYGSRIDGVPVPNATGISKFETYTLLSLVVQRGDAFTLDIIDVFNPEYSSNDDETVHRVLSSAPIADVTDASDVVRVFVDGLYSIHLVTKTDILVYLIKMDDATNLPAIRQYDDQQIGDAKKNAILSSVGNGPGERQVHNVLAISDPINDSDGGLIIFYDDGKMSLHMPNKTAEDLLAIPRKCSADYYTTPGADDERRTVIGDPTCCGDVGDVVKSSDDICTASHPVCAGYNAATGWGRCFKDDFEKDKALNDGTMDKICTVDHTDGAQDSSQRYCPVNYPTCVGRLEGEQYTSDGRSLEESLAFGRCVGLVGSDPDSGGRRRLLETDDSEKRGGRTGRRLLQTDRIYLDSASGGVKLFSAAALRFKPMVGDSLIAFGNSFGDWLGGMHSGPDGFGIQSLGLSGRYLVHTLSNLASGSLSFFGHAVKELESRNPALNATTLMTDFDDGFTSLRLLVKSLTAMVPEVFGDISDDSLNAHVTGDPMLWCQQSEFPNVVYINSLKSYTFIVDKCGYSAIDGSRPMKCDSTNDTLCVGYYVPYQTFNTNPVCAATGIGESAVLSVVDIVHGVAGFIIDRLSAMVNDERLRVADKKGTVEYPQQLVDSIMCNTQEVSMHLGDFVSSVCASLFETMYYGISEGDPTKRSLGQVVNVTGAPVDCEKMALNSPEPVSTCTGVGSSNSTLLSRDAIKIILTSEPRELYRIYSNPVCAWNFDTSACVSACPIMGENECINHDQHFLVEKEDGSGMERLQYCVWNNVTVSCETNEAGIARFDKMGLSVTYQPHPINAAMATFVGSVFNVVYYMERAIDGAFHLVLEDVFGVTAGEEYSQSTLGKLFSAGSVGKRIEGITLFPFEVAFEVLINIMLWIRDVLFAIIQVVRAIVMAVAEFLEKEEMDVLEDTFTAFQAGLQEIIFLIETLVEIVGDAILKLVRDTVELVLRVTVGIGTGFSDPDSLKQLAIDVWHVIKDYANLLAEVVKNIFLNTGIGEAIMDVVNVGCEIVNDVVNAVQYMLKPVCTLLNLKIEIWRISIDFSHYFGGAGDSAFCEGDITDVLTCNAKFTDSGQSKAMEASVCYGSKDSCEYCVYHTPDQCGDNTTFTDSLYGKACQCNRCKDGIFSCDSATGMCVCGSGTPLIEEGALGCSALPQVHVERYDVIQACITDNSYYYNGLCPIAKAWTLKLEGDTAGARLDEFYGSTALQEIDQALLFTDNTVFLAGERQCSTFCSLDPRNERNDLVTFNKDGTNYVVCAVGIYTGLMVDEMNDFAAAGAGAGVRHRALLQADNTTWGHGEAYPSNSFSARSYSNATHVWADIRTNATGSACSKHSTCYSPEAMCYSPWGSLSDMVPCASCHTDVLAGRASRSCHALTSTCVCGNGWEDDGLLAYSPDTTPIVWEVYAPFMRLAEWPGNSRCDIIARAYIKPALASPTMLSALERVELAGCMQRKTIAMHTRAVTGVPTLPLGMFHDPYVALKVARDVFVAAIIERPQGLETQDEIAGQLWDTFDQLGIDPILGLKVSDTADKAWSWLFDNVGGLASFMFNFTADVVNAATGDQRAGDALRTLGDDVDTLVLKPLVERHKTTNVPLVAANTARAAFRLKNQIDASIASIRPKSAPPVDAAPASDRARDDIEAELAQRVWSRTAGAEHRSGALGESAISFTDDCTLVKTIFDNTNDAIFHMNTFYGQGGYFTEGTICQFKSSLRFLDLSYTGSASQCGNAWSGRSDRRSKARGVALSALDKLSVAASRASARRPGEPGCKNPFDAFDFGSITDFDHGASPLVPYNGTYKRPAPVSITNDESAPSLDDVLSRGGFTNDVARALKTVGMELGEFAVNTVDFLTCDPSGDGTEGAAGAARRATMCDLKDAAECKSNGTLNIAEAFTLSAVATILIVHVVKSYLPTTVLILLTPVMSYLMIDGALMMTYGYSFTMCTRLAFNSAFLPPFNGIPFVSIPQCIFDDLYAFFDTIVMPRHIDWGPTLFPRGEDYVIHPKNVRALECLRSCDPAADNLMDQACGFSDGFDNMAYLAQRWMGDDWLDRYPVVRYIRTYPIDNAIDAFEVRGYIDPPSPQRPYAERSF